MFINITPMSENYMQNIYLMFMNSMLNNMMTIHLSFFTALSYVVNKDRVYASIQILTNGTQRTSF